MLHDTSDMYAAVRARGGDLYVEKSVTWQQEVAGDHHLRLIRADGVIKSEVEEYKRELRRWDVCHLQLAYLFALT